MPAIVSRKEFVKNCLSGWASLAAGLGAALKREAMAGLWSSRPRPRIAPPRNSVKRHG
jgi:hypothetical protein